MSTAIPVLPTNGLEISTSRMFPSWIHEVGAALAFTTYQAGRLMMLGLKEDGTLSLTERMLECSMGIAVRGNSLYVSSLYQIWRFDNTPVPGVKQAIGQAPTRKRGQGQGAGNGKHDACYAPRMSFVTGDLDVHDMAFDGDGSLVFVNTMYGCLAKPSSRASFTPVWQPPFTSRLVAEDRCHLNGMAADEQGPAYVTAVSQSDVTDGWRDHRTDGGVVIDVRSNEVVGEGFSMPHSPRLYAGKLWLLDSGNGYFGTLDPATGHFERLTLCPGYARGLSFISNYAVIGLSLPRGKNTFEGLPLDDMLAHAKAAPRCGLLVVDITTGETVHWLRIEGKISELYDVAVLPGIRRPALVGFKSDDIRRKVQVGQSSFLHASAQGGVQPPAVNPEVNTEKPSTAGAQRKTAPASKRKPKSRPKGKADKSGSSKADN